MLNMGVDESINYFKYKYPGNGDLIKRFANLKDRPYRLISDDEDIAQLVCNEKFNGHYYPSYNEVSAEVMLCKTEGIISLHENPRCLYIDPILLQNKLPSDCV